MVTVAAAIGCVGIAVPIHGNFWGADAPTALKSQAQPQSPGQAPSTAATRAVRGEWRSREQFGDQPRATVVVHEEDRTLAGSLTLLGMTRGDDDRATLRVPFRLAGWDGTTLTFETALGNEGTTRWDVSLPRAAPRRGPPRVADQSVSTGAGLVRRSAASPSATGPVAEKRVQRTRAAVIRRPALS
jgi:hypothetical protein